MMDSSANILKAAGRRNALEGRILNLSVQVRTGRLRVIDAEAEADAAAEKRQARREARERVEAWIREQEAKA